MTPLEAREAQLERRRKLRDAMQARSITGPERTEMAGGHVVPYSGVEGITRLLTALVGRFKEEGLSKDEEELASDKLQAESEATRRVEEAMSGKPQSGGPLEYGGGDYQQFEPSVKPDPQKAAMIAATDPALKGNTGLQKVTQAMMKGSQGGRSDYYKALPITNYDDKGRPITTYKGFDTRRNVATDIPGLTGTDPKYTPKVAEVMASGKETGKQTVRAATEPSIQADIVTAKGGAEKELETKTRMERIPPLIENARIILSSEGPTSSGFGAMVDSLGAFFGVTVEGAAPAAKLAAIGGALVGQMPRFEGPQSDADRDYYAMMAGRIGDSKVPIEARLSALQVVSDIWANPEKTQAYRKNDSNFTEKSWDNDKESRYQQWKAKQGL